MTGGQHRCQVVAHDECIDYDCGTLYIGLLYSGWIRTLYILGWVVQAWHAIRVSRLTIQTINTITHNVVLFLTTSLKA